MTEYTPHPYRTAFPARLIVLFLLGLLVGSCGGPPSRDAIGEILEEACRERRFTNRLATGYFALDEAGTTAFRHEYNGANRRQCDWSFTKNQVDALQAAGYLTAPELVKVIKRVHRCGYKTAYVWGSAPASTEISKLDSTLEGIPQGRAVVARGEFIEVTGVTVPTEGTAGPTLTAEFTYRWVTTPIGDLVAQHRGQGTRVPTDDPLRATATLVEYDDGWRLETVDW